MKELFIIGNPRSGTSLLRLMLTCHPEIVIPPESHFFLWLEEKYGENFNIESIVSNLPPESIDISSTIIIDNALIISLFTFMSGGLLISFTERK